MKYRVAIFKDRHYEELLAVTDEVVARDEYRAILKAWYRGKPLPSPSGGHHVVLHRYDSDKNAWMLEAAVPAEYLPGAAGGKQS